MWYTGRNLQHLITTTYITSEVEEKTRCTDYTELYRNREYMKETKLQKEKWDSKYHVFDKIYHGCCKKVHHQNMVKIWIKMLQSIFIVERIRYFS